MKMWRHLNCINLLKPDLRTDGFLSDLVSNVYRHRFFVLLNVYVKWCQCAADYLDPAASSHPDPDCSSPWRILKKTRTSDSTLLPPQRPAGLDPEGAGTKVSPEREQPKQVNRRLTPTLMLCLTL